jgi:hypothetical protein
VKVTDREYVGFVPVIARHLVGHVDNASYPLIDVNIDMVVVTPANAKSPVPLLLMFERPALPAPAQPNPDEAEKLNNALRALLIKSDPSLQAILDKYPAYEPLESEAPPWPFGPYRSPTPQRASRHQWNFQRSAKHAAVDRRRLGLCNPQPYERSSR